MTTHVPDAAHQAALVARLEAVEHTVVGLLRDEEEWCRQDERLRQERGAKLVKLRRQVEALRHEIQPQETVP